MGMMASGWRGSELTRWFPLICGRDQGWGLEPPLLPPPLHADTHGWNVAKGCLSPERRPRASGTASCCRSPYTWHSACAQRILVGWYPRQQGPGIMWERCWGHPDFLLYLSHSTPRDPQYLWGSSGPLYSRFPLPNEGWTSRELGKAVLWPPNL